MAEIFRGYFPPRNRIKRSEIRVKLRKNKSGESSKAFFIFSREIYSVDALVVYLVFIYSFESVQKKYQSAIETRSSSRTCNI